MPHYADGTEAKVGDTVRGKGYNDSKDKEIVGTVVDVRPGDSCTLSVLYIESEVVPALVEYWKVDRLRSALILSQRDGVTAHFLKLEYGDTKGFQKI